MQDEAGARALVAVGTLVVLALSGQGAGAFLVHVASSCPLAANGSVLDFDFAIVFNKNPLVCYDPTAQLFVPCDWGLLHGVADVVAANLNNDTGWLQRAEARHRACRDLGLHFWASTALRRTPPQVRIVASKTSNARTPVLLTCHVWGFYPAEVTLTWLHNEDVVATKATPKVLPNGDWTYQTQVMLRVTAKPGDTFTCSVEHSSLEQPLQKDWGPGLSPGLVVKVVVAAVMMTLGLVVFAAGTFSYCRQAPGAGPGSSPGLGSGPSPGSGPGPSPSSVPSASPGLGPHSGPGPGPSSGLGPGPGSSPGLGSGTSAGSGPGPDPDSDPGPDAPWPRVPSVPKPRAPAPRT
ncbi:HLA class II histocompatibility antigen, DM beta chain-like [Phaenicophaeus curvirostris]|uniref:HLA class II histocompatibility antigen, DM beta chain-like n=1 Tax=Phaenicophaeus curvirostris TaxID=33595 RepID=UPI0037F0992D